MTDQTDIPDGYSYDLSISAFINHIGRVYSRREAGAVGDDVWAALRIEQHHVNAWNLCHGAVMASMAEIGTAGPGWDPDGPPVVAIEMSMQFIGAPKLGELLEVRGILVKKTRSLVFTRAEAEVDGKPIFIATSVQKVIGN